MIKKPETSNQKPEKILIRTPNWLGDSVMSIPAVKGMKKVFPQAELWIYTRANLAGLWKFIPEVNGVLTLEKGLGPVRQEGFDLALLLTNSFRSTLQMYLAGVPLRRGYRINARRFLLTQPVPVKRGVHQIEYFLGLIEGNMNPSQISLTISSSPVSFGWKEGELIVGIHGTAKYGPCKCWIGERFAKLIDELKGRYNPWILIFGSRDEEKAVEDILSMVSNRNRIINMTGRTNIEDLAGYINLCKLFIANDSGPMHLACALGVPVIAIFGSTDPSRTGPRGNAIVIKKDFSCSPCFKRRCPRDLGCMKAVSVGCVMQAVERMM